jgi:type I restriction enzyme S subunit
MKTRQVRLGDVLILERTPVDIDLDAEYQQIGIRSFGKGIFHRDPCRGSELSKLNYFEVNPGRLVISNIMAWEGAIGVSTQKEKGFVGSARFLSYRPTDDVDIRYLNYYFQSPTGLAQIRSASTGTVTRNQTLSPKHFESIRAPLPEVEEQQCIADRLDILTARIKRIVATPRDLNELHQLTTSGLDQVVARWATSAAQVGDVCTLVSDVVFPGDALGPAKEFIGLEHVSPHLGIRTGSRPLGDERGRKLRFQSGDVLYGYLRPYLNKVWLADRPGLCSVEQYVLRPNGVMPGELLAACLRGKSTLDKVQNATHNLQLPRLRSGLLLTMEIPFVPPSRRRQAIADINAFMHKVVELRSHQYRRDEFIAALPAAFLDAAFAGRLSRQ